MHYNIDEELKMSKIKDLTIDELEQLIEQKIIELLGDPDSGLGLKSEFRKEMDRRLKSNDNRLSRQEIEKKFA